MKIIKKTIAFSVLILILGLVFKKQELILNVKDVYIIISYFTLACYIVLGIILFWILLLIMRKIKSNR